MPCPKILQLVLRPNNLNLRVLKKVVQQDGNGLSILGVAGMMPTARVQRGESSPAHCVRAGIAPVTPSLFQHSLRPVTCVDADIVE